METINDATHQPYAKVSVVTDGLQRRHPARVGLFSAYYPSHMGGMEMACGELARAILQAGMHLEWVAQTDNEGDAGRDLERYCIPVGGTDIVYRMTGVPVPLPMPLAIVPMAGVIARAHAVVIAEANFALCVMAFVLAKLRCKPIILVQHVGKASTVSRLARLVMAVCERLLVLPMVRWAEQVVCVSPMVAQHVIAKSGRLACHTIGLGVDTERFRVAFDSAERNADRRRFGLTDNAKVACFVGRLTPSKGIGVIEQMARDRPDWTFAIAGIGAIDPAQWDLGNVVPLGRLEGEDVARLYRASDCMVLPSQSESFSLVVREAMASGCRVLCSDQILDTDPRLSDFISTAAVDLADVLATARRFCAALDHPPACPRDQARAYVVEHCSWAAAGARYVELIETVLADAAKPKSLGLK